MRSFVLLLVALALAIQTARAQTSATVYVQPSGGGSYNNQMSTSFVGLKLPSGGGSVYITITPGDYADGSYVTSFADHTQDGPYDYQGSSTSFYISTTGHYWMYLSEVGTTSNFDWLEIRVEASTYSGTVSCYYCNPPSGWQSGWPPLGTHQVIGPPIPVSSQPAPESSSSRVPTWAIAVLGVVIGLAVLIPASYLVYRQVKKRQAAKQAADKQGLELAQTSVVV